MSYASWEGVNEPSLFSLHRFSEVIWPLSSPLGRSRSAEASRTAPCLGSGRQPVSGQPLARCRSITAARPAGGRPLLRPISVLVQVRQLGRRSLRVRRHGRDTPAARPSPRLARGQYYGRCSEPSGELTQPDTWLRICGKSGAITVAAQCAVIGARSGKVRRLAEHSRTQRKLRSEIPLRSNRAPSPPPAGRPLRSTEEHGRAPLNTTEHHRTPPIALTVVNRCWTY